MPRFVKYLVIVVFFCSNHSTTWSQQNYPNIVDGDTNSVRALNDYAWNLLFSNTDSAEIVIHDAIDLSEKLEYDFGKAAALRRLGILNDMKGDFHKAISYWQESKSLFEKIGKERNKASVINNLGLGYYNLGEFDKSEELYNECLNTFEKLNDQSGIASAYNNIARIYDTKGDFKTSLGYYLKSLSINTEIGDKQNTALNLMNIGIINQDIANYPKSLDYFEQSLGVWKELNVKSREGQTLLNIGYTYFLMKNFSKADSCYQIALDIQTELGALSEIALLQNNIGRVYIAQGKYEEAIHYVKEALDIREKIEDVWGVAYSSIILGEALYKSGNIDEGLIKIEEGRKFSKENDLPTNVIDANDILKDIYKEKRLYAIALDRFEEYDFLRDSINDEESNAAIAHLESKFFQEKVESDLEKAELINERNRIQRLFLISGILAAILAAFALFHRYKSVRKSRNIIANEKKKSDNLLLNILPEKTAEELKEHGSAKAQRYNNVSVLFTDFVGFTKLSGELDPAELVSIIDKCFSAFDEIVGGYNVEKIKTIGDAYMCVSGLPTENDKHAHDLIRVAFEFQRFLENGSHNLPFTMRLGIHSGSVVAGIVGKKKFAYDIWGDTVNTAARMESNGEPGKVNISESTYRLVKDDFNCIPRGELEAKGKGKLKMYFVDSEVAPQSTMNIETARAS